MSKELDRAVRAFQIYAGADGAVNIRIAQKLYERAIKLARNISQKHGADFNATVRQLCEEAGRRGRITPIPGKDY